MEFMAECVKAVLDHEKVEKAMLVGHSMGGYVSLAFAEAFPQSISALVLFSSSCFEDTPERKSDRERAIKLADAHKMKYITSVVPNLFFERSGMKASKRIFKLVKIAAKQPKEGIAAAIRGMKDRADRSEVIRNASFPCLFLAGQDDLLIPLERIQEMHRLQPTASIVVLENCGHVGFIEQKRASIQSILNFALEKIL
jgi:pimeloyl-ACP methyl ester carboxylesterase